MNLIFLRHEEATNNVKELISDKEIYWSILTEKGKIEIFNNVNFDNLFKHMEKLAKETM